MQDDKGAKGYHDAGGDPAGDITMIDLPWLHWEKQVEAMLAAHSGMDTQLLAVAAQIEDRSPSLVRPQKAWFLGPFDRRTYR